MTVLRTALIALVLSLMITASARAGTPLATDDAGTVDVGAVEIELNGSFTRDKETVSGSITRTVSTDVEVKITTGLYKNLGISLKIPYTLHAREKFDGEHSGTSNGLGDMNMEIKYALAELGGISFAVKPTIIMPTGRYSTGLFEGRWQYGGALIASRNFCDGTYAMHANLGYEHHSYNTAELKRTVRNHFWSGSVAGEARMMSRLATVLDFGVATNPDKGAKELPVYALTGVRYEVNDHFDINAGVKLGLTRPEADISALYGLVLKF